MVNYTLSEVIDILWVLQTNDPWSKFLSVTDIISFCTKIKTEKKYLLLNAKYLEKYNFSKNETCLGNEEYNKIRYRLKIAKDNIESLKSEKIKPFLKLKTDNRCCYCYKNLYGEFNFIIDIEHILPKSIFHNCIFDIENLSVACERCNMMIKKDRIDFLNEPLFGLAHQLHPSHKVYLRVNEIKYHHHLLPDISFKKMYFKSEYYKFIHPNLDIYTEHMNYHHQDINGKRIIFYQELSDKGRYTYNFFELSSIEINAQHKLQGIKTPPINDEVSNTIHSFFKK
ncbi:MAG: hypothetical protein RSD51_03880 [Malacoplasma sp.]